MRTRIWLPLLALAVLHLVSCRRSQPSHLPTAADATGRAACPDGRAGPSTPLVVDMQPEQRADLEVAMRRGVVVVRWDCDRLVVLPRCGVDGAYAYEGTSPKEQVLRMVDGDAVRATLPVTGNQLAAQLSGAFEQGTSLDLALVMVGKHSANLSMSTTDDLRGSCGGATHVVQSATLGAFAMTTGARSQSRTAAEIFGAGVSATSGRSQQVQTKDGLLAACSTAAHGASAPPAQCDAVLRVELMPVEAPLPPIAVVDADLAERLRGKLCPDPEACRSECERGDGQRCRDWGVLLAVGDRVPRDLGLSTRAFRRACELGNMDACTMIGIALLTQGPRADVDRGRAYLERACERGTPAACTTLAVSHDNAGETDRARAYLQRACDLGDSEACR